MCVIRHEVRERITNQRCRYSDERCVSLLNLVTGKYSEREKAQQGSVCVRCHNIDDINDAVVADPLKHDGEDNEKDNDAEMYKFAFFDSMSF